MNDQAHPQPTTLGGRFSLVLRDIKIAHSIFALPFAVLGAFLSRGTGRSGNEFVGQLALVVVCMVLARTWAMLVNRLADARIDADNPRTAGRAIASGRLGFGAGLGFALGSAALFVGACTLFWVLYDNPWPTYLSVPTLAWIAFYSFTKRFTWLCHVFLGGALAASPLAAAIAVRPGALADSPALWWIAGMVLAWVAGFDVIYALQDEAYDRQVGLSSVPARFGWRRAVWFSRVFHVAAAGMLVMAGLSEPRFAAWFWAGAIAVAGVLVVEHAVLATRGRAGLPMAFFTCNGVISCLLGTAGVIDLTVW